MLSYDDALFYKILAQTGYIHDVTDWIDSICYSNEALEGIFLDLVSCYGNLNAIISLLQNYIGDNPTNDIEVCNRLRLFLLGKLNSEKITIEEASKSLQNFAVSSGKMYEDGWYVFSNLSNSYDYVLEGDVSAAEYFATVRQYIETGIDPKEFDFWKMRQNIETGIDSESFDFCKIPYEANSKKEKKYKVISGIVLALYSLAIILLEIFILRLIGKNHEKSMDIAMPAAILISCIFIVPPVVFTTVGWDTVYALLSRGKKQKRKKIKEEKRKIEQKLQEASDEIRRQYNLSDDMMTLYDYRKKAMMKMCMKWKWILLGICEILCLSLTIGSALYFELVSPPVGILIIFSGVVIGIYGFCILCDAYVKGLLYSFLPVLCYAIPLAILYYLLQIHIEWMLGLFLSIIHI
ncbi:MAG: hypothetical protein K2J85_03015 [Anaeroplasmataceae bacterium]|nr:hypothetical protein [Anaeroplasmataceae bacterium]